MDGGTPQDNPFSANTGKLAQIWSYGLRNPQGLAYDLQTDRLWCVDHGPRGGDEINLIMPGENYGWADVSHGFEYWIPVRVGKAPYIEGMQDPLKSYTPSIAPYLCEFSCIG